MCRRFTFMQQISWKIRIYCKITTIIENMNQFSLFLMCFSFLIDLLGFPCAAKTQADLQNISGLRLLLPLLRKHYKRVSFISKEYVSVYRWEIQYIRMIIQMKHLKNAALIYYEQICLVYFFCVKRVVVELKKREQTSHAGRPHPTPAAVVLLVP